MKTVYFLGAGASAGSEFRLPTMRDFFQNFHSQDYPDLAHFFNDKFPNGHAASLNLEDVITHLELNLEGFGARWKPAGSDLFQARNDCLKYIQRQLDHIPPVIPGGFKRHSEIFRAILGHSQKEDTFITLNYDLIFDYSIHGFRNDKNNFFGEQFTKRLEHIIARPLLEVGHLDRITPVGKWEGFFLKLHGSLGWSYCPQESCINHQQFYPDPPFGGEEEVGSDAPCRICGSVLVSVIIPPALGKSFEKYPKMGILWNIAYREIRKADKLVFIGMSLPESDYYLRWLLREVPRPRVLLDTR